MIPLFKSHYSICKSILTLNAEDENDGPDSIFSLAKYAGLKEIFLVEDSMSSFLPSYIQGKKSGVDVRFGLRVTFVSNLAIPFKEDDSQHKNIIFVNNEAGYKRLIKLSTLAAVDNYDIEARLDYETLHRLWSDDDLSLAVPFYDSFIFNNFFTKKSCLPNFGNIKPVMFIENNDLPFDLELSRHVKDYAGKNNLEVLDVKSIYYNKRSDFLAWQTLKLMNRKGHGSGNTLEDPNLEHCSSDEFSFESWIEKRC